MSDYISEREAAIIDFRPKSFSYAFRTYVDKVSKDTTPSILKVRSAKIKERNRTVTAKYNSFVTLDMLLDTEEILLFTYKQAAKFSTLSDEIKENIQENLLGYSKQIKTMIDTLLANDFGGTEVSYGYIKKKQDEFIETIEEVMADDYDGENTFFYKGLEASLQVNKMLMEYCKSKTNYCTSILLLKDLDGKNADVYKYNENELSILSDMKALLEDNYKSQSIRMNDYSREDKLLSFLRNGFSKRNSFIKYNKDVGSVKNKSIMKKQALLGGNSKAQFLLFVKDFYKYNRAELRQMSLQLDTVTQLVGLYK